MAAQVMKAYACAAVLAVCRVAAGGPFSAPTFECQDREIETTYNFRWEVFRRHIKETENGFVVTEFTPNVYWSGKHNTINCAAGHHLLEARWLHDDRVFRDYLKFYFRAGRMSGRGAYVCWPAYAALEFVKTTGDRSFAEETVQFLAFNYEDWERGWRVYAYGGKGTVLIGFDADAGLFRVTDEYEGAENSVSGDGFRPLINSAMYAEASAIAELARIAERNDLVDAYGRKAAALAARINEKLWNGDRKFFNTLSLDGKLVPTRELFGYAPWYFDLPMEPTRGIAFAELFSEDGFQAPFGLTGVERRDPAFKIEYDLTGPAVKRNGPTWPYETTIALRALERAIRRGAAGAVRDGYAALLHQYAAAQRLTLDDGTVVPWIDEDLDPFTGKWIAREVFRRRRDAKKMDRGRDYNHSGFCDLVICGYCGIVPRADDVLEVRPLAPADLAYFRLSDVKYHGRSVSIEWDRDGSRYARAGLSVYVDGEFRAGTAALADGVEFSISKKR